MWWWLAACTGDAEPEDPGPNEGSLSVLTYNVQGLPDVLTDIGRPTEERMERIAPFLEDYDVIGVQEDFDAGNHELLVGGASHPVSTWFDDRLDDGRFYGSGLAQLARGADHVESFHEHYTECNGLLDSASDCLASKGFQVLRLDLGGGALLDVYNTHHEAGGDDNDDAARRSQVEQVLASMAGRSDGIALLFMGDTNLRWTDPEDVDELQLYADAGLLDACDEVGCPETDHIDRFYVRDSDDVALTVDTWSREAHLLDEDGVDLSDHPAIAIDVSWSKNGID